jgi:hypothetical protein
LSEFNLLPIQALGLYCILPERRVCGLASVAVFEAAGPSQETAAKPVFIEAEKKSLTK